MYELRSTEEERKVMFKAKSNLKGKYIYIYIDNVERKEDIKDLGKDKRVYE